MESRRVLLLRFQLVGGDGRGRFRPSAGARPQQHSCICDRTVVLDCHEGIGLRSNPAVGVALHLVGERWYGSELVDPTVPVVGQGFTCYGCAIPHVARG